MAKRFKMRISRVITSFQSCRSKDAKTTTLPVNPVFRLSPVNPKAVDVDFPATRHHVPVVSLSGCGCGSCYSSGSSGTRRNPYADSDAGNLTRAGETPAYLWGEEEKWHVVARVGPSSPRRKIDSDDGELFPPLLIRRPVYRKNRKWNKKKKRPASLSKARVSTSSADTHLFTSEDEYEEDYYDDEESETLMSSSRSLSTESSAEFNPRLKPIRESLALDELSRTAPPQRCDRNRGVMWSSPETAGWRGSSETSVLCRLMPCTAVDGGKMSESFAVVKRSEDPYGDFRRSMVEMIMEKKMYDERDLEQLLHCFLSLNSRHHHPVIVQAFSEIWDALFSGTSSAASPRPPASANPCM